MTWMNFPNLEELLFLIVLALPNASKIGFESIVHCSKVLKESDIQLSHPYKFDFENFSLLFAK